MNALVAVGSTLGPRIAGLLDRSFLFASLLPAALFAAFLLAVVALGVAGPGATVAWLDALTPTAASLLSLALAAAVLVLAQILAALDLVLLGLWSGLHPIWPPWPLRADALQREARRRTELLDGAVRANAPAAILDDLRARVHAVWCTSGAPPADAAARAELVAVGVRLGRYESVAAAAPDITRAVELFRRFDATSLDEPWRALVDALERRAAAEQLGINASAAALDRAFGPEGTLRPMRLGNLMEAGDAYPFRRYGIEGQVFWPRLGFVAPTDALSRLEARRCALAFWLAAATLAILAAVLVFLAALVLPFHPVGWLASVAAAGAAAWACYRIALVAGEALVDHLRAACDVLRFDVASALRMPPCRSLGFERQEWALRSAHALYGTVENLRLHPPPDRPGAR